MFKGLPLPPRGSARDQIMREMLRRERAEKTALARLFAYLLKPVHNLQDDALESMIGVYVEAVTHDAYRQAKVSERRKVVLKKRQDRALLQKVEKLTIKDEDLPKVPKKKTKKRGRR